MARFTKIISEYLPIIILLFLVSDFLTNISIKNFDSVFRRYSGITKLLFEIIMIVTIIIKYKQFKRNYIVLLSLVLLFILSQFLYATGINYNLENELFHGNIYYFNRYLYILLFIIFIKIMSIEQKVFLKTYTYFEYFLYVNSIAIFIGLIYNIELFRSYEYSSRFGYSGFFSKPGEASYMYIIAIVTNFYFWIIRKDKINLYKIFFFIIVSLFLGQKKVLFFLLVLGLFYGLSYFKYKKWIKIVLLVSIPSLFVFKNEIIKYIMQVSPFWQERYDEFGLLSVVTSYRNLLLEKVIEFISSDWRFWNYLFGGIDFIKFKTEFELVDLYLFLGFSGILFYIYIVYFHFMKNENLLKRILIVIVFLTSFISGGLLLNVSAIVLFYIAIKKVMLPIKKVHGN